MKLYIIRSHPSPLRDTRYWHVLGPKYNLQHRQYDMPALYDYEDGTKKWWMHEQNTKVKKFTDKEATILCKVPKWNYPDSHETL